MVSQQAVDNYLTDLRSKADTAVSTFGVDDSDVQIYPDRRVKLELVGRPTDTTPDGSGPTPADIRTNEERAPPIAEELREKGADTVNTHMSAGEFRVIAIFTP